MIPASLPVETIALTPMFRSNARFTTMPASAPLCEAIPSAPGTRGSSPPAGEKVSGTRSQQLMKPSMFGPSTAIPAPFASAASLACRLRPSASVSANPAVRMTAFGIPRRAASSSASNTWGPGTPIQTTSGRSGSADSDGYAL